MESGMRYLEYKNAAFFHAAQFVEPEEVYLLDQAWEYDISDTIVSDPDGRGYYSLVLIQFEDEGGYQRALFCPLPIVMRSRTKGALRLRRILKAGVPVLDIDEYHRPAEWVIKREGEEEKEEEKEEENKEEEKKEREEEKVKMPSVRSIQLTNTETEPVIIDGDFFSAVEDAEKSVYTIIAKETSLDEAGDDPIQIKNFKLLKEDGEVYLVSTTSFDLTTLHKNKVAKKILEKGGTLYAEGFFPFTDEYIAHLIKKSEKINLFSHDRVAGRKESLIWDAERREGGWFVRAFWAGRKGALIRESFFAPSDEVDFFLFWRGDVESFMNNLKHFTGVNPSPRVRWWVNTIQKVKKVVSRLMDLQAVYDPKIASNDEAITIDFGPKVRYAFGYYFYYPWKNKLPRDNLEEFLKFLEEQEEI